MDVYRLFVVLCADNAVIACLQEFYAKLQHNNQRFNASWHELNGLRLSMTHAF